MMIFKNLIASYVPKVISYMLWLLFFGNLIYIILNAADIAQWHYKTILNINGFTILIWTIVTFFSALISSYGINYLKGFDYHSKFSVLCFCFVLSIMIFMASNHVSLLLTMWLLMGVFMAKIIGIDSKWGEAREASKLALTYFVAGSLLLSCGVILLAFNTQEYTISGIILKLDSISNYILIISGLCIITAALIQSAIYPFHRWLLSAMTAPTPASALMHAGFVNGSGILLTLFSMVLFQSNTLTLLFILGGLTAIVAQFTKLLQVNVKQRLACSTIAQMGFMIMQCGLGLFNAAIVHLILHGFYKAYLFLSSGEEIQHSKPEKPLQLTIKPLQVVFVLLFGVLGAFLFNFLTGKSTVLNTNIFLTLIVAITVGQVTYNIVKEQSLTTLQKLVLPPILFVSGIISYALIYNVVTVLMRDMPMTVAPMPISAIEIGFGILFLVGFFIMKLGVYRKYPWLYVKLLNISQPHKKTVLMYKSK